MIQQRRKELNDFYMPSVARIILAKFDYQAHYNIRGTFGWRNILKWKQEKTVQKEAYCSQQHGVPRDPVPGNSSCPYHAQCKRPQIGANG